MQPIETDDFDPTKGFTKKFQHLDESGLFSCADKSETFTEYFQITVHECEFKNCSLEITTNTLDLNQTKRSASILANLEADNDTNNNSPSEWNGNENGDGTLHNNPSAFTLSVCHSTFFIFQIH